LGSSLEGSSTFNSNFTGNVDESKYFNRTFRKLLILLAIMPLKFWATGLILNLLGFAGKLGNTYMIARCSSFVALYSYRHAIFGQPARRSRLN
jgi:hypothetical protein